MPRDPVDELYDDEDELPEEWPARAIETMPFWGQLLAWLSWKMPLKVYVICIAAGVGGIFWIVSLGVAVALVSAFALFWGFYCRTNYPSPWGFVVIQTRAPVPGELRRAAAHGRPVPPENLEAARETAT